MIQQRLCVGEYVYRLSLCLFKLVLKCHPPHSGHNPIMSSIFSGIDIPFVVCVIYWSLPTSGSPQEIAWNGPKLVYDCAVSAAAVVALILCPPHLGICFKLICIVFRGVAAGALILPGLQAGDAAPHPNSPPHPCMSLKTTESE